MLGCGRLLENKSLVTSCATTILRPAQVYTQPPWDGQGTTGFAFVIK